MSKVSNLQAKRAAKHAVRADTPSLVDAIKLLLSQLSTDDQHKIIQELTEFVRPISLERAGEILETIAKIIPLKNYWTVKEVKEAVSEQGVIAESKEVYNAIGYLTRKGHMRRVGYGRYVIDGLEIVTADDLGGDSSRYEDGYRLDRE